MHTHSEHLRNFYFSATLFSKTFCKVRMKQRNVTAPRYNFNLILKNCFKKRILLTAFKIFAAGGIFVHKNKVFAKISLHFFEYLFWGICFWTSSQVVVLIDLQKKCAVSKIIINALLQANFCPTRRLNFETKTSSPQKNFFPYKMLLYLVS